MYNLGDSARRNVGDYYYVAGNMTTHLLFPIVCVYCQERVLSDEMFYVVAMMR